MVPREAKMVHSLTLRQHVLNHPLPQDSALQLSASLFLEDSYIVAKAFAPLTPANFYLFLVNNAAVSRSTPGISSLHQSRPPSGTLPGCFARTGTNKTWTTPRATLQRPMRLRP
jgi:hypothetical protein